jgi:hypothetical protein
LDKKLAAARDAASTLQKTIEALASELASLRQAENAPSLAAVLPAAPAAAAGGLQEDGLRNQILRPNLGGDERDTKLSGRPELFIQSRYQTLPLALPFTRKARW